MVQDMFELNYNRRDHLINAQMNLGGMFGVHCYSNVFPLIKPHSRGVISDPSIK